MIRRPVGGRCDDLTATIYGSPMTVDRPTITELRAGFAELHRSGGFVMPNVWDRGTVRMFTQAGYPAIATTSAGHGRSIGKQDQEVTRDELLDHVADVAAFATVPLNVDSERLFPDDPGGITGMVDALAEAGASGCSIEDYEPNVGIIDVEQAAEAVAEAAEACGRHGITLTARAENLLYGVADLDDTIERLLRYRDAGAHCLYAPGLTAAADIEAVVTRVAAPVNVLALSAAPRAAELIELGVRRVSAGSRLYNAARAATRHELESL